MSDASNELKYFICGGFAGMCNMFLGYPMDTLKVRLQTMPLPKSGEKPMYSGGLDCFFKSVRTDGFCSLFKGISMPLLTAGPAFAINFSAFSLGKRLIKKDVKEELTKLELMLAGSFAGLPASFVISPAEHIKCLMQVESDKQHKYDGVMDCVKKLYAEGGLRAINKGLIASLIREVPGTGAYFFCYETAKELVASKNSSTQAMILSTFFSGGCAGIGFWVVGMPGDVLKTIQQTAPAGAYPNGLRDIFRELMAKEGIRGFYKGLTVVIVRAFPLNAATFMSFELAVMAYDWLLPPD